MARVKDLRKKLLLLNNSFSTCKAQNNVKYKIATKHLGSEVAKTAVEAFIPQICANVIASLLLCMPGASADRHASSYV